MNLNKGTLYPDQPTPCLQPNASLDNHYVLYWLRQDSSVGAEDIFAINLHTAKVHANAISQDRNWASFMVIDPND